MAEGQSTLAMDEEPEDDERVGMTVYGNENTDGNKEGSNIGPKLGELCCGKEPDRVTVNKAAPLDDTSQSEGNGSGVVLEESNENFSLEIKEKLRALHNRGRPINILVIGSVAVGKSQLINSMFGMDVAKAGHGVNSGTTEVHAYEGQYKGVKIKLYDTPGFRNFRGISDRSILLDIDKHGKYDVILICTKLVERADRNMFLELASYLHEEMWKRTVVVLTFANHFITLGSVTDHHSGPEVPIRVEVDNLKTHIVGFLSKYIKREVLDDIPFCIAGMNYQKKLPTTDNWLKSLWETCIDCCSDEPRALMKDSLCVIS